MKQAVRTNAHKHNLPSTIPTFLNGQLMSIFEMRKEKKQEKRKELGAKPISNLDLLLTQL